MVSEMILTSTRFEIAKEGAGAYFFTASKATEMSTQKSARSES